MLSHYHLIEGELFGRCCNTSGKQFILVEFVLMIHICHQFNSKIWPTDLPYTHATRYDRGQQKENEEKCKGADVMNI
jgi:hypothetical protein